MKLLAAGLAVLSVVTLGLTPTASATPIATFSDGMLSGFIGITVGSSIFKVSIVDGTCAGVFGVGTGGAAAQIGGLCNVPAFAFQNSTDATAASNALYAAIVGAGFAGMPDSILDTVNPGAIATNAIIWTPYAGDSVLGILTSDLRICAPCAAGQFDGQVALRDHLNATGANSSWGVWHDIPEPSTLALFGVGLFGLGALRRRRKTNA